MMIKSNQSLGIRGGEKISEDNLFEGPVKLVHACRKMQTAHDIIRIV